MKNKICIILSFFAALAFCIVEIFRGIIVTYINMYLPLGASIVSFWLLILFYLACIVLILWNIVCLFRCYSVGKLITAIVSIAISLLFLLFPYTELSFALNYNSNEVIRTEIIEQLQNGAIDQNRIDTQEYWVSDLRLSYTGTVLYDGNKVLFYLYKGIFSDIVLIYSPLDEEPKSSDFSKGLPEGYSYNYEPIKKICDDYWIAYIK